MSLRVVYSWLVCLCVLSSCSLRKEVLLIKVGWKTTKVDRGVVLYTYSSQFLKDFDSYQNINVLALDLKRSKNKLKLFNHEKGDSLSSVSRKIPNIIASINGTYFEKDENKGLSTSFLKINGQIIDSIQINPKSLYGWKHEGCIHWSDKNVKIISGNNKVYKNLETLNIISGAPVLIEDYYPKGVTFVKSDIKNLERLKYEDPNRHQGVRHPRTAVAITDNDIILFVVVDGRNKNAAGMTSKELTIFLQKYFKPKDALNLDGGGSSTMWLKQSDGNGVVNYPSDNKKWDHNGQRIIKNGIYIVKGE
ncbi:phosphodiester glycosidase family protein [Elizabethkingia sp. JS20170427COW]|uniref:phosphodiester glycosidase family protein n=1 Tax=Elizabethkingia sp. JS20170427COW TaxID=2583851 RepID=UPI001110AA47|nr:phosphodiester glycosidase family protein [Elizabethkingia sp. JS20170427COW]QCX53481.1 phosphodiester glycosidase family protein [Elizabethkingia sp. JS20170427COW]